MLLDVFRTLVVEVRKSMSAQNYLDADSLQHRTSARPRPSQRHTAADNDCTREQRPGRPTELCSIHSKSILTMFYWPRSAEFIAISLAFQSPGLSRAAGLATCDGLPAWMLTHHTPRPRLTTLRLQCSRPVDSRVWPPSIFVYGSVLEVDPQKQSGQLANT